jgi:hypothetical protein
MKKTTELLKFYHLNESVSPDEEFLVPASVAALYAGQSDLKDKTVHDSFPNKFLVFGECGTIVSALCREGLIENTDYVWVPVKVLSLTNTALSQEIFDCIRRAGGSEY